MPSEHSTSHSTTCYIRRQARKWVAARHPNMHSLPCIHSTTKGNSIAEQQYGYNIHAEAVSSMHQLQSLQLCYNPVRTRVRQQFLYDTWPSAAQADAGQAAAVGNAAASDCDLNITCQGSASLTTTLFWMIGMCRRMTTLATRGSHRQCSNL